MCEGRVKREIDLQNSQGKKEKEHLTFDAFTVEGSSSARFALFNAKESTLAVRSRAPFLLAAVIQNKCRDAAQLPFEGMLI